MFDRINLIHSTLAARAALGAARLCAVVVGVVSVAVAAGMNAGAADISALQRAQQRGTLAVGLAYVPPVYKAGAKFRTPAGLDSVLAQDTAARLKLQLALMQTAQGATGLTPRADVALAFAPQNVPTPAGLALVPTGYSAAPIAILRTDTDIKSWAQLRGRTVCLSEGGPYVGQIAARFGAIEQIYRAPADALLALRIGTCDAAVDDDTLLDVLLKLPEWKKFSNRLDGQPRANLVFVLPAADRTTATALMNVASQWQKDNVLAGWQKKWVDNVAFEVYLDQNVPDCH